MREGVAEEGAAAAHCTCWLAQGGDPIPVPPFRPACALTRSTCCKCSCRVGRALLAAGVACCRPQYVVDYLAHPWQPLDPHRLWGSTAGAELATLEAARAQDGQGQPQCSISF